VGVRSRDTALVDLGSALTAACTYLDAVLDIGVRAAAELVGDYAGIRVPGADGRDGRLAGFDRVGDRDRPRAEIVTGPAEPPERPDGPLVLPALGREQLHQLTPPRYWPAFEQDAGPAAVLCPLITPGSGDAAGGPPPGAYLGDLVLVRTDGGGYTDADVALVRDIAGQLAPALATARAVERLRASELAHRRLAELSSDGVWQLDPDGVARSANERLAELLGVPRERLVGVPAGDFLDGDGRAELSYRLGGGAGGRFDARLVRPDGTAVPAHLALAQLTAVDGQPAGCLCVVTDASERIAAREQALQLEQLRRLDSLGQLAAGIAHDFNNLLTVMAGCAELLSTEVEPDSSQHELAVQIVQAAARGTALTQRLLAYGQTGADAESVSVPEVLAGLRELLARTLGEHIRLDISAEAGLWPVRAERGQLELALVNLATNARDAMGRGGVLTIEAVNTVIDPGQLDNPDIVGRFVRLSVSDTGTGMDRATQQRACEPFFSTKHADGGGLGLATVAGIVRGGDGHLQLYSEPGVGTTVRLFLPVSEELAARAPSAPADATQRRGRILVVEDQPELGQLTRCLLEPAGYIVTVATDAAGALAHIHTGAHPDLLLTDVVMPGMTGPELAKALRARRPGLRVLYMSGYTPGVLNPRGHLDEHSSLLQKPFNRDALLAAVARALGPR